MHEDLRALDPDYRIERFDTNLRVTVADRFQDGEFTDRATAPADTAETTCETCGRPGRICLRGDGPRSWMQASCDTCRTLPVQRLVSVDSTEINRLGNSRS